MCVCQSYDPPRHCRCVTIFQPIFVTPDISIDDINSNPSSKITTISLNLEKANKVVLKVFDTNGKLVATLADQLLKKGSSDVIWNTSCTSNGIYALHLVSGNNRGIGRFVVMH